MSGLETPLLIGGLGLSAIGSVMQAVEQRNAAKYNAALAEQQARQRQYYGEVQKYKLERRKRQMLGTQRSLYAKAGVDISGTPLEVLADTAAQFELDKAFSIYNTGVDVQRQRSAARLYRYQGRQAFGAGMLNAAGTLLTGAYRAKKLGW